MSRSRLDGGAPARRAVVRWTRRLVRRDWRQHTTIVVLLTIAVAASVVLISAAYNIAPAHGRAEMGNATDALHYTGTPGSSSDVSAWVAAGAEAFGTVDTIGHRNVAVPGTLGNVDYRAADVNGHFTAPLLALRSGRAPSGSGEAALTDGVASLLGLGIGDQIDLDGVARQVVGIVENPSKLNDEFVLIAPTEIAGSESVTMLASPTDTELRRFGDLVGGVRLESRSSIPDDVFAGVLMLLASTVVLLLVALVASASFTVIAQRRLPQLGMLSAVGATERHIRLSMVVSGAITGIVAAVAGATVGVGLWMTVSPLTESLVNHRIDPFDIPWLLVGVAMLLALLAATAAAWWPARTMARIPTVLALSGRTPRAANTHRSSAVAIVLLAGGVASLYVGTGFDEHDGPNAWQMVLLIGGTLAVIAGVLFVSPLVIRSVGRLAGTLPIGGRLAIRDLSRHQARSSAALAAIGLALGIPAAILAGVTASENASPLGNLSSTQLMVHSDEVDGPFALDASSYTQMQTGVDQLVAAIGSPAALRIDAFVDPAMPTEPKSGHAMLVGLGRPVKDGLNYVDNVYAATPELLAALGLDQAAVAGGDIVTSATGNLRVFGTGESVGPLRSDGEAVKSPGSLPDGYTSLPSALLDPNAGSARGWTVVPSGLWLIELSQPLKGAQLDEARDIATRYGFTIETRDGHSNERMVRLGAGLAGMLLALGVLAATVGLIRGESANDIRTLTATGATRSIRRGITAVTAGTLALLGAVLGITSAYIGLLAGRVDHLAPLPWFDLALIAIGTPLIATVVAWLLAGGEPAVISRRPLD